MKKKQPKAPIDHIFGELDQSSYAGQWLIKRQTGVHHYHTSVPENPKPGEKIRLLATTAAADSFVDSLNVWYTTDDWETVTQVPFNRETTRWNTILWSYVTHWSVELPPQAEGAMLRYRIAARYQGSEDWIYADTQAADPAGGTDYAIWISSETLPDWAREAVVYQIFVDRFNPGEGRPWLQQTDLRKPFGGTLQGVIEKLDVIHEMGFNALWLTPIMESPTHHGYDITHYYQIDQRFGDLSDYRQLIDRAHDLNIKVIMDLVLNHCSNQHPFFLDALKDQDSPYHDYFVWRQWPEYECFFNVRTMPKINLKYGSPARDYFLDVARYWLDFGVDGFRLDYANGPEQDFWVDFRQACSQVKKDVWTFGEVVAPPDVQKTYANGLSGTLDFLLCRALRMTFAQREWPLSRLAQFITTHFGYFPEGFSQPSFIDNHDMNRFLFTANENERLLRMALLVLYTLPGPPIVYYGTEGLLSQNKSIHEKGAKGFDEARLAMPWHELEHMDLPQFIKQLAQIRSDKPGIYLDAWQIDACDDDSETLVLRKAKQTCVLLLNRADEEREMNVSNLDDALFVDPITDAAYQPKDGRLMMTLAAESALLLIRS